MKNDGMFIRWFWIFESHRSQSLIASSDLFVLPFLGFKLSPWCHQLLYIGWANHRGFILGEQCKVTLCVGTVEQKVFWHNLSPTLRPSHTCVKTSTGIYTFFHTKWLTRKVDFFNNWIVISTYKLQFASAVI